MPLGICGPIGAILLAFALRTGAAVLIAPLSTVGALVCSLMGARDTNPDAANMHGRGLALAGVLINMTLTLLMLAALLAAIG